MLTSFLLNAISFIILCLYFYGRSLRKTRVQKHIKVMSFVIFSDVALILFLVFGRSALSKVDAEMPIYLVIHIGFALSTVIFYGLAIYYGLKLKKGQRQYLPQMRKVDTFLTPLRVLTLVTSTALMFFS